jgi:hypothetical protein
MTIRPVVFYKSSKGEKPPEVYLDITCKNPETYHIKIEKRKFKYTAFVEVQGEKGPNGKKSAATQCWGKIFIPA